MTRLILTLAAGLLAAGFAFAGDDPAVRTHSLQVKERLSYIERIDVTAEKPANPDAEPLDAELQAILAEVEREERSPAGAANETARRE